MNKLILILLFMTCLLPAAGSLADTRAEPSQALDKEVEALKKAVLELNRELFILEEELLFPGNTQVSVFLSVDAGNYFTLDSVQLLIDDKELTNYLYTPRELEALERGGTQRLYLGNLKTGKHELTAFFLGKGPHGREYKRGATVEFEKGLGPKFIELKIVDDKASQQPDFEVREWE